MSKIKVVLFDAGGVLVRWKREMYDDLKTELGLSEEQVQLFREKYLKPFSTGTITEVDIWENATRELGIRPVTLEENLIGRAFANTFQAYKEVTAFVEELKSRGYRVALLSNTNDVHSSIMKNNKVFEPFEDIFLSHEMGLRKPNPEIYKETLKILGVKADEVVFTDDTPENIVAAKELGMKTVLAKNSKQIIRDIENLL